MATKGVKQKASSNRAQSSREVELKLNGNNESDIVQVDQYIRAEHYYAAASRKNDNSDDDVYDNPTEIERIYFDTLNLSGFRSGIEIRVEHRTRSLKDDKPYKMVVKIDAEDTQKGKRLDRLEETYRMTESQPDFSVIDDKPVKDALKAAFGVKKLDNIDLYPLVRIMAQRAKYTYHPDGDKKITIEFDRAVGKGHDFTGYSFDLFQCELEIKSGAETVLEEESRRLCEKFGFLTPCTESKPTPGFKHLDTILNNKKARKFAQTHLKTDSFRVLNNIPF